jgi:hypothetical protein
VDCESSKGKGLRVLFADSTRPLRNMHGLWHPVQQSSCEEVRAQPNETTPRAAGACFFFEAHLRQQRIDGCSAFTFFDRLAHLYALCKGGNSCRLCHDFDLG